MRILNKIRLWTGYFLVIPFLFVLWRGWIQTNWGFNVDSVATIALWFLFLAIIGWIVPDENSDIRCTWCSSIDMEFVEGKESDWFWEYRNKDGSRDKRVLDNYQMAGYVSVWECKKCSAISAFTHYASKNPSKEVEVWKGSLIKTGKGKRTGKDFEKKDSTIVDINSENRKRR